MTTTTPESSPTAPQASPSYVLTLEPQADLDAVRGALQAHGLWTTPLVGRAGERCLTTLPHSSAIAPEALGAIPGVASVFAPKSAHPAVDRQRGQTVPLRVARLGGPRPLLMAGPCAAESERQVHAAAQLAAAAGATMLRGGAFKPRTSPYSFSGEGPQALRWLVEAARDNGLGVVTEVMSEADVDLVADAADLLQIGSRNMQNFALLRAIGRAQKPVLLKRGRAASVDEWLMAGEHALAAGASHVIFCERGILGADPATRNLLDLGAVALLAHTLGQPVVVDPSHAAGRRDLVRPLAAAALAAGAHGLIVETHPDASRARSDGAQALPPHELLSLGLELGFYTPEPHAPHAPENLR